MQLQAELYAGKSVAVATERLSEDYYHVAFDVSALR